MRSLAWYGKRFLKYYILNQGYRKVYGSFRDYCRHRKSYEERGR